MDLMMVATINLTTRVLGSDKLKEQRMGSKAYSDLIKVRVAFEDIEHKMTSDVKSAVKKHGMTKTAEVLAEVAGIRERMKKLSVMLAD